MHQRMNRDMLLKQIAATEEIFIHLTNICGMPNVPSELNSPIPVLELKMCATISEQYKAKQIRKAHVCEHQNFLKQSSTCYQKTFKCESKVTLWFISKIIREQCKIQEI